jgi:hypothetical protein
MGGDASSKFSRMLFRLREIRTNQQKETDRLCEKSLTHGLSETTRTGRHCELNGWKKLGSEANPLPMTLSASKKSGVDKVRRP